MSSPTSTTAPDADEDPLDAPTIDATERIDLLLRDLRTSRSGLSSREAQRRLVHWGPNALAGHDRRRWPRELGRQFTHPLALLLWVAAVLAFAVGIVPIGIAIVVVIVVNAVFAFIQEAQAERAVDALKAYLPARAVVRRDGEHQTIEAVQLVPGDVLVIAEGDHVSADARLVEGAVDIDLSTLSGESAPVLRSAELVDHRVPLLQARELVFSGTTCTGGEALAVVYATGMRTELGRIAALSQGVEAEQSPLERQVRTVAWVIAGVAVALGAAFIPLAMVVAHLPFADAVVFAVGLLVGNVPEGLLPVITLALAVGVRDLARRGAIVKRLSAVEALGATDVICTDKTGTLTENRMTVTSVWQPGQVIDLTDPARPLAGVNGSNASNAPTALGQLAHVIARCNNASIEGTPVGDPTEIALVQAAATLGASVSERARDAQRRAVFNFDPTLKVMTTVDERDGGLWIDTKGAPEAVLARCRSVAGPVGGSRDLDPDVVLQITSAVDELAGRGLRVLAVATGEVPPGAPVPTRREQVERDLCFVGLVALMDPPRPEVAEAVVRCRSAGIRVVIVTGDHPRTATEIARQIGIVTDRLRVMTGAELDATAEADLDTILAGDDELVFARVSPEAKLRIADALHDSGKVVAMTGDGVNDAPALRRADIGVAMGRTGTDVAREAATVILTDDHFATIVTAIEGGRRTYDNVRKFLFYIFAHTTPEVVPFLVFALSGGAIPLPLPILLLLAFDVGTETLPALALGREPAEPGIMTRPPRARTERVVDTPMLVRAWLFVGAIAAGLAMAAFFHVLTRSGWRPGDPVDAGSPFHDSYLQATTTTFLALVAGQIGTAFAARTERTSLRSIGVTTNRALLGGIAFELALAAAIIYLPPIQNLLGTAPLGADILLLVAPFPFIIWGADELRRFVVRRRHPAGSRPARVRSVGGR